MAAEPGFIYLGWGKNPATSVVILWQSAAEMPARVEYRPAGTAPWQQASGSSFKSPGAGMLHRVDLVGLRPATIYDYRVMSDNAGVGQTHTLRTAGEGAFDYRFVFITDTGLIGRLDGLADGTKQIIDEVVKDEPLFVLGGGDYAYGNQDGRFKVMPEAGDEWFRQWQPVLTRFPFMPQYGNHEVGLEERLEEWIPRFAHPKDFEDGRCYSFDVGEVHFTSMFCPEHGPMPSEAERAWLDGDLAAARKRGARWLIAVQHAPIYGHGVSHSANATIRSLLAPIYEKHRVDLVITGHDQSYERTFPLVHEGATPRVRATELDRYQQGQGVIYAKVSPSGKKSEIPRDFSRFKTEQQPFIAVRDDNHHHYAVVDVRADGRLDYTAFSVVGNGSPKTILDRFTISSRR